MQSSPELTKITSSSPELTKFKMTRTDKESLIGASPHLVICSSLEFTLFKVSKYDFRTSALHTFMIKDSSYKGDEEEE